MLTALGLKILPKDTDLQTQSFENYPTDVVKSVTLILHLIIFHIVNVNFYFNEAFPFRSFCY